MYQKVIRILKLGGCARELETKRLFYFNKHVWILDRHTMHVGSHEIWITHICHGVMARVAYVHV